MEEKNMCTLKIIGSHIFLDDKEIKGIEEFRLLVGESSNLPHGQAELDLKLIVEFPENMLEQNLSQAET